MIVHELANEAGVSTHVVRYYTKIGLLTPKRDPKNRYKYFGPMDVKRLRFVKRAQLLGLTLAEIKDLLLRSERGTRTCCGNIERKLHARLKEVRKRIARLQVLENSISEALSTWESRAGCGTQAQTRLCPLIETINEGDMGNGHQFESAPRGIAMALDA